MSLVHTADSSAFYMHTLSYSMQRTILCLFLILLFIRWPAGWALAFSGNLPHVTFNLCERLLFSMALINFSLSLQMQYLTSCQQTLLCKIVVFFLNDWTTLLFSRVWRVTKPFHAPSVSPQWPTVNSGIGIFSAGHAICFFRVICQNFCRLGDSVIFQTCLFAKVIQ